MVDAVVVMTVNGVVPIASSHLLSHPSDERLGLDSSCTDEDIRRAYRRQALLHHPDRHEEENREEASERFRHALEAYEKLNHPDKRKAYDQSVLNERYSSSPFESPFYDDDEGFVSFRRNMKPTRFSSNVHRRGTRSRQSGHASAFDLFDQMHSRHSNIFPSSMFNDESSFGFSNMGVLLMDEIMRDFDEDFNDLMGDTSAFSGHSFFNRKFYFSSNSSFYSVCSSSSLSLSLSL